jgi:hypothetical protein
MIAAVLVEHEKLATLVLSKRKEVKVYEEIDGVICSFNVSCDIFVDWLQSITAASETSSRERRERSTWSAWSAWGTWSTWSAWSACTRKKIDAGYRVYPPQEDIPLLPSGQRPAPEARHVPVPYLQRCHMDRPALLFNL